MTERDLKICIKKYNRESDLSDFKLVTPSDFILFTYSGVLGKVLPELKIKRYSSPSYLGFGAKRKILQGVITNFEIDERKYMYDEDLVNDKEWEVRYLFDTAASASNLRGALLPSNIALVGTSDYYNVNVLMSTDKEKKYRTYLKSIPVKKGIDSYVSKSTKDTFGGLLDD